MLSARSSSCYMQPKSMVVEVTLGAVDINLRHDRELCTPACANFFTSALLPGSWPPNCKASSDTLNSPVITSDLLGRKMSEATRTLVAGIQSNAAAALTKDYIRAVLLLMLMTPSQDITPDCRGSPRSQDPCFCTCCPAQPAPCTAA